MHTDGCGRAGYVVVEVWVGVVGIAAVAAVVRVVVVAVVVLPPGAKERKAP